MTDEKGEKRNCGSSVRKRTAKGGYYCDKCSQAYETLTDKKTNGTVQTRTEF